MTHLYPNKTWVYPTQEFPSLWLTLISKQGGGCHTDETEHTSEVDCYYQLWCNQAKWLWSRAFKFLVSTQLYKAVFKNATFSRRPHKNWSEIQAVAGSANQ